MKVISFGYTDTITTSKKLDRPDLDFKQDFAKVAEEEHLTIVSNLTTPVDQPETFRWQIQDIADIYKGSGVDPSVHATSKKGFSLVVQVNDILRVTDDQDPSFQTDLPVSAHLVLKAPKSQYLTEAALETVIGRCVAALFSTGSTSTDRLKQLVRGAMTPSEM